jgi:Glycosyl transferase family 2
MTQSPIALFTYRRLEHTQRTIAALQTNHLADRSDLIIFSDGSKNETDIEDVTKVRDFLKTIEGFRSVSIIHREQNIGLANSIIGGVTDVLRQYERIIVVEDDLVTSPHFLTYMNDGLETYANTQRVVSIHGYLLPVEKQLPETFFRRGADCWGWGTWRRGWACFNPDGQYLLDELKKRRLTYELDLDGAFPFTEMLKGQIAGKNNSWAIRWHASAFLADKLTLYPGRSLVFNIGHDNSGTHCVADSRFDVDLSESPIKVGAIEVEPLESAITEFKLFLGGKENRYRIKPIIKKIRNYGIKPIIKKIRTLIKKVCK